MITVPTDTGSCEITGAVATISIVSLVEATLRLKSCRMVAPTSSTRLLATVVFPSDGLGLESKMIAAIARY